LSTNTAADISVMQQHT